MRKTMPCQTSDAGHFVNYTGGHFVGTPLRPNTLEESSSTRPFLSGAAPTSTQHETFSPSTTTTGSAPVDPTSASKASSNQSQPHWDTLPTTKGVSPPEQAFTNSAASTKNPSHSSSLPTATGLGIGIPLGIAATGFLGYLFAREARLKEDRKKVASRVESGKEKARVGESMPELNDEDRPFEMTGDGIFELPGTAAKITPIF